MDMIERQNWDGNLTYLLDEVIKYLWLDAYWTEDREQKYCEQCRSKGRRWVQNLDSRPETPPVPNQDKARKDVLSILNKIEAEWGCSFRHVWVQMQDNIPSASIQKPVDLVYRTVMACIGHGIGPDDDGTFPEGLSPSPIYCDNPMVDQVIHNC